MGGRGRGREGENVRKRGGQTGHRDRVRALDYVLAHKTRTEERLHTLRCFGLCGHATRMM